MSKKCYESLSDFENDKIFYEKLCESIDILIEHNHLTDDIVLNIPRGEFIRYYKVMRANTLNRIEVKEFIKNKIIEVAKEYIDYNRSEAIKQCKEFLDKFDKEVL